MAKYENIEIEKKNFFTNICSQKTMNRCGSYALIQMHAEVNFMNLLFI